MAAGNKNLNSAKTARKDEFYTQLTDIEFYKHTKAAFYEMPVCPDNSGIMSTRFRNFVRKLQERCPNNSGMLSG